MSSQLSAHATTAQTAITRISVSRCSTLPAHRGSASAEKCSTSFSTDIATLPSLIKGEPAQPVSPSEPARPFHALPLPPTPAVRCVDRPDDRLPTGLDCDALDPHGLLAVATVALERFDLRREGSRKLVEGALGRILLRNGFDVRQASREGHGR